ncbi:MAG: hypothetical protein OWU33_09460 [Firmicutes bacterium]|nr:hypothetical protein [Bacillota bacterium]
MGNGLLVSLFTVRETDHVQAVARQHHLSSAQGLAAVNHPAHASTVAHVIQDAETLGFQDVVGVIAGISLVCFLLGVVIRLPQKERKTHDHSLDPAYRMANAFGPRL